MVFVGGGTQGHVSPNLAIISEIKKIAQKKNLWIDFLYVGRKGGIEKEIVEKQGLKYKGIFTGKLRRYWSWRNFSDPFLILIGLLQSFLILIFNRPNLVFAKGGFVTVPFGLACALLQVPLVIHESDSRLGLSNKILQPFAKRIYLGFPPEAYVNRLMLSKIFFSGNPVREEIFNNQLSKKDFYEKYGLNKKKKVIFVFGGSQGAGAINKLIDQLISRIVKKYILIHSTGREHENYFKEGFFDLNEKDRKDYLVFGYIGNEMPEFLNNADLIISRAGANSVAEIIAAEKPSIIIPLSSAAGDHQKKNAEYLERKKVAAVLEEKNLTPDKLWKEIDFLINNKKATNAMIKNMENVFPRNSGRVIAEDILKNVK